MKRSYNYVEREDVQACKELVRVMIKRDKAKNNLEIDNAKHYEYYATRFFDCMRSEFRTDLEEWAKEEIIKSL